MEGQMLQSECSVKNLDSIPDLLLESANEVTTASDQLKLGIAYFQAYHLQDNCLNAFKWIKLSAEQGNNEAQFRLAELYSLGQGTSRSHTDAYKWYTKAAIQGYKKALIRIHNLYQEDIKMHCRGRLNSEEVHRQRQSGRYKEKVEQYYRELNEQRLNDHKLVLNHAIDYYAAQFKIYKASNQKDAQIQQNLGFLYQHGYGVKKCDKWAIEYYTKAAEQGSVDSQYQLGCLYQQNTDIKFNYKKAFHWLNSAANGGNIAAQNRLAYLYEKGVGTDIDYRKAIYWYTKAAGLGHSGAQLNLGKWYRKGEYVDQDYDMAFKWYSLASRQGNSVAQNCLTQLYQTGKTSHLTHVKDMSEDSICGSKKGHLCSKLQSDILKLNDLVLAENMKKLAKRALVGDGNSMYQIGLKYYYGTDFAVDKQIGFKWIKKAADTGLEEAIFRVIKMYEEGDTVEQDYHKVAIWTKRIARTKNSKALCDLGILYNESRGVRNDPMEASKWFTLSAEQGNSEAQYQLGCLRQEGRGLRTNEKEALKLFELSAKQGNINGCYKFGLALSKDNETYNENKIEYDATTIKLLIYCSENGSVLAQYKLWKIYHDKKIKSEASIYFDMLMHSNDISIFSKMLVKVSYYTITLLGFINYFNLLKKAANLGISVAQNVFDDYFDFKYRNSLNEFRKMFTLVSIKGVSSIEYKLALLYENENLSINGTKIAVNNTVATYWYDISAKKGDSRALVRLGILCEEGIVVEKDFAEAIKYYNLAYEKGNKDAMYRLACMYLEGRGISQNLEKAFQLFSQASDMGHIEARKVLMLSYNTLDEDSPEYKHYQQIAVEINHDNRMKMLEKMASAGLVAIQYQLGTFYQNDGAENENRYGYKDKDELKAVEWLTLAAQNGVTDSCYRLAVLYEEGRGVEQDCIKAMVFYKKAIRNEHEDSMYRLAQMFLYGKGTEINYKKAYELYSRAAKMGHVLSCNVLDFNLISDEDQSSSEINHSLLMLRHVAEEGDTDLQYELGHFYESSLNEQSYEEAAKWYSMAVDNYHAEAMYSLGVLYETGSSVDRDYKKAIRLYAQAYSLGNYDALFRLGMVYQYGVVADIDPEKAVQYYTEAAINGHLKSQHALGKLYEEGLFTEKDILEALRWYTRAYLEGCDSARINLYANYDDLPYENYFFVKRHKILLSVSNRLLFSDIGAYNEIYGFILYKLGIDYLLGSAIAQDYEKAWKCFRESATRFRNNAALWLTHLWYGGDRDIFLKAVDMFETLSGDLNVDQLYSLAMIYYDGVSDTSKDATFNSESMTNNASSVASGDTIDKQETVIAKNYSKAIFYLDKVSLCTSSREKSRRQISKFSGTEIYEKSQKQMAKMYTRGLGVEKNIEKVIEYYTKAYTEPGYFELEMAQLYHFESGFCNYSEAIEWYKRAAECENENTYAEALNIIGLIYRSGIGVDQDYIQALHYFKMSANLNDGCACYNLGIMYYQGQGVKKNHSEAYKWFKTAAEKGHTKAQTYVKDSGVNKNPTGRELYSLFLRKNKMRFNYFTGESIWVADVFDSEFRIEAIEWCKKIQENDPVISFSNIEHLDAIENTDNEDEVTSRNHNKPLKDLMRVAQLGEGVSLYTLGEMYYSGEGVQKDYNEAYAYFLKGSEANNPDAQYMLAEMYLEGHGVEQDIEKAIELYKKVEGDRKATSLKKIGDICVSKQNHQQALLYYRESSELGTSDISIELGEKYYKGEGVDQDYKEAHGFYKMAADKNNFKAHYILGEMYLYGQGVDQNINQAIHFLTEAGKNNSDAATAGFGKLYHTNDAIQDFPKAFEWYQKVQGSNKSHALRGIGLLFEHGDGVDQNYKKAVKYYQQAVKLGDHGAYYNLALMYFYGKGIDQDYKTCFDLLSKPVKREQKSERTYVFVRTINNSSAYDDKENRLYSLESRTALHGEMYYQLGIMYKNGHGVDQNHEKAGECFAKAIDRGNEQAKNEGN